MLDARLLIVLVYSSIGCPIISMIQSALRQFKIESSLSLNFLKKYLNIWQELGTSLSDKIISARMKFSSVITSSVLNGAWENSSDARFRTIGDFIEKDKVMEQCPGEEGVQSRA